MAIVEKDLQPLWQKGLTDQEIADEIARMKADELAIAAAAARKEAQTIGADYNGYMVSFRGDDGNAMVQTEAAFRLGATATVIHFVNGTKMPITANEFPAFAQWFILKRNEFFLLE